MPGRTERRAGRGRGGRGAGPTPPWRPRAAGAPRPGPRGGECGGEGGGGRGGGGGGGGGRPPAGGDCERQSPDAQDSGEGEVAGGRVGGRVHPDAAGAAVGDDAGVDLRCGTGEYQGGAG